MSVWMQPASVTRPPILSTTGRTFVELKGTSVTDAGELTGYGATWDVDDVGDQFVKGCFAAAIPDFLREGFLSDSHRWDVPVAYPVEAREDDRGLFIRAKFHNTEQGQRIRTIAQERLAMGKSVGLSVGFDEILVQRDEGIRKILTVGRLFEVAVAMVPVNRAAGLSSIKATPNIVTDVSQARVPIIDIPAFWVAPAVRTVVERAWRWSAWSLGLEPVPMTIHYFSDADSPMGKESASIGFAKSMWLEEPLSGYVTADAYAMWLEVDRSVTYIAKTVMHEARHLADLRHGRLNDEPAAVIFSDAFYAGIGGIPGLFRR